MNPNLLTLLFYIILSLFFPPILSSRTQISILTHPQPPANITAFFLLHQSHSNLTSHGFRPATLSSHCFRLLSPEHGAMAIIFPSSLACARFQPPNNQLISLSRSLLFPPTAYVSRDEVYDRCEGRCAARYLQDAVVATTFHGFRFVFRKGGLFFEQRPPEHDTLPLVLSVLGAVLCLQVLRSKADSICLTTLMLVLMYSLCRDPANLRYELRVKDGVGSSTETVAGYELFNFSREQVSVGSEDCVIYTCNAYADVKNLRYRPLCDVVNFRTVEVRKGDRRVVMNWLKILFAIWIVENESYSRMIYIDRDLILTEDPLPGLEGRPLVFPDLGGGRPDSAMFVSEVKGDGNGTAFFDAWLGMETGETNRRDGGEEQEMLINLHSRMRIETVSDMYSFQCGRNAMNRAQCLLQSRRLGWNKNMFFSKVAVELGRIAMNTYSPGYFWMPTVFAHVHGSVPGRNVIACLVGISEVLAYSFVFSERALKESKCSAAAIKSISHGSFDNPFQKTLTGVFSHGVARRGQAGWNCYEFSRHEERWENHWLSDLYTFAVAQVAIVLFSFFFRFRHLLNPLRNIQMSVSKKD